MFVFVFLILRTPGTGLYDNLQKYSLPYPEAVFDINYFHRNPEPFFKLSQELYPSGKLRPNLAHYFVRLLQEKGILRRMYTQNIDGLERLAGLEAHHLVEAHGTFSTATCLSCSRTYTGKQIEASILKGEVSVCLEDNCRGVVKPDIVFFGEQLPARFSLHETDLPSADLLVVMGTSLEVFPFAGLADEVKRGTPRMLFNMEATSGFRRGYSRDVMMLGDIVEKLRLFCADLGWSDDLYALMNECES